jgi:phosphoribosyl-AMP cyclohydrolase
MTFAPPWLEEVAWNEEGLIPVIAQEIQTGQVLMLAWMNRKALLATVRCGHAVYWSRSRKRLWHKGEQSGHQQRIKAIHLDCDNDAILLLVEQKGGIACHTGRHRCFFKRLEQERWASVEPVLKSPDDIYGNAE